MTTCSSCRFFSPNVPAVSLGLSLPIVGQCRRYPPSFEQRQWGPSGMTTILTGAIVRDDGSVCGEYQAEPPA